jgi:hypothetical protein
MRVSSSPETEAEREERERRTIETLAECKRQFLADINAKFVGKKIAKIGVTEDPDAEQFDPWDGKELHIELDDGSRLSLGVDYFDIEEACLSADNVSLHEFKRLP